MSDENIQCQERRKPLSAEEIETIKEQLLQSIYADIGKSIIKKMLWIGGAVLVALYAWLNKSGHL